MKAVLISIKPKWCELIESGLQTLIVRKTRPKLDTPFKCYIYETKGQSETPTFVDEDGNIMYDCGGEVIGEFVCNGIEEFHDWHLSPCGRFRDYGENELQAFLKSACLSYEDVCKYRAKLPYYKPLYGWHISELKIYDKPIKLVEFRFYNSVKGRWNKDGSRDMVVRKPPQSWCYVEEVDI